MPERGLIKNRERAKQLRDYSGLCFDTITPTDVDGLIEYHGRGYILIEVKFGDAPMDRGQRLAFERLTDDLNRAGRPTIFLIVGHDQRDPEKDIDVGTSIVTEYRYNRQWRIPKSQCTTREITEWFLEHKLSGCPGDL